MPEIVGIKQHSGSKYVRRIFSAVDEQSVEVDVYCVLAAFQVTCPATQHAIKKLLCSGIRGKADKETDLREAIDSIYRAISLHKNAVVRGQSPSNGRVTEEAGR